MILTSVKNISLVMNSILNSIIASFADVVFLAALIILSQTVIKSILAMRRLVGTSETTR